MSEVLIDGNKAVAVRNRDTGTVGYSIPEMNLHRNFAPNEKKRVTVNELRALSYIPGGDTILKDYLVIEDQEVVAEVIGEVEPEYFYSREDVKQLLLHGSYDELVDCLNFAPDGVLELVKDIAIETQLNDVRKRDLITNKLKVNINTAIKINQESKERESVELTKKTRLTDSKKTVVETKKITPARNAETPKYTVIDDSAKLIEE